MTRCWRRCGFQLALVSSVLVGGAIAFFGDCVLAQIAPDGTLPNNSIVTPSGNISVISGGTQAGSNLFHSFEQFSIPTGDAAYFNNALNIQNIFSRVTGKSISNIDGLIQAKGTANLFLLNPNGIIFGPNASLNIGGSFVGTTASSLNFADGTKFSATAPPTTPLLTVSVPIGLQYGGTAGGIQVQGSGLQVQPSQTLALVGGDVSVEGGEFGFLEARGGRIELGGLAGAGMVDIEGQQSEGTFRLTSLHFPDAVSRADVLLTNYAYVNVAGGEGGSIAINARNIDILGGSILLGGIEKNLGFLGAQAGDIELSAQGAINVADSVIANNVRTGAVGNSGDIDITTESLAVINGAQLVASTYGQGDAGNVNINARDTVSFDGVGSNGFSSAAFSTVESGAVGNGGNINITAGSLAVTNGARLDASILIQGDAGNVNINARDTVSFDGVGSNGLPSGAFTNLRIVVLGGERGSTAWARAGSINIEAGSLSVTNGAELDSSGEPEPLDRAESTTIDIGPLDLPTVPTETEVAQICQPGGSQAKSEFSITGRGGLPPNPGDSLSTDAVQVDLITLNPEVEQPSTTALSPRPTSPTPAPIVEAQGWVIDANGNVVLTATAPNVTPHSPWISSATCHTPQASS